MSPSDLSGFLSLMTAQPKKQSQSAKDMAGTVTKSRRWCALSCSADNALRRMEGQQETMFLWVSSGRWETIIVFGMLSVIMQLLFWSKIVEPVSRRTRGG